VRPITEKYAIPETITARYAMNITRTRRIVSRLPVERAEEARSDGQDMMRTLSRLKLASAPLPPIWREGLFGLELGALLRDPVFRDPPEAPRALPVMLVPGFLTGDAQMATLASWLRRCGHRVGASGMRLNVDCSEAATTRLERRLEAFVALEGEPAVLIGQSRGGLFARVLAVRRPDLVRSLVTLGSPHREPLAVHPLVWVHGAAIAGLAALGVRGLASRHCRAGECCARFGNDLGARVPAGVQFVSIYSKRDGIVDWRACLDPHAVSAEVDSTHCGMGVNAEVYLMLDAALHPRRREAPAAAPAARAGAGRVRRAAAA
jgi:triacylglycerol lipase